MDKKGRRRVVVTWVQLIDHARRLAGRATTTGANFKFNKMKFAWPVKRNCNQKRKPNSATVFRESISDIQSRRMRSPKLKIVLYMFVKRIGKPSQRVTAEAVENKRLQKMTTWWVETVLSKRLTSHINGPEDGKRWSNSQKLVLVPQPNFNKIRIIILLQSSDTDKDLESSVKLTHFGHPVTRDASQKSLGTQKNQVKDNN